MGNRSPNCLLMTRATLLGRNLMDPNPPLQPHALFWGVMLLAGELYKIIFHGRSLHHNIKVYSISFSQEPPSISVSMSTIHAISGMLFVLMRLMTRIMML